MESHVVFLDQKTQYYQYSLSGCMYSLQYQHAFFFFIEIDEWIVKSIQKFNGFRIAITTLKKNKVQGLTLLDFKTYKAIVIKIDDGKHYRVQKETYLQSMVFLTKIKRFIFSMNDAVTIGQPAIYQRILKTQGMNDHQK